MALIRQWRRLFWRRLWYIARIWTAAAVFFLGVAWLIGWPVVAFPNLPEWAALAWLAALLIVGLRLSDRLGLRRLIDRWLTERRNAAEETMTLRTRIKGSPAIKESGPIL